MLKYCSAFAVVSFVSLLPGQRAVASDQIPGATQTKPVAIVGGTLHTVSGETIQNGTLLFDEGRITYVGQDPTPPDDAEVIQAEGKHVYPGLIEAGSNLGLVEINSVWATVDSRETGKLNPNAQSAIAFNPDSELIPVNRANGILAAVIAPSGGLIAGRSSMMLLDGWTREDMTLKADTGMHVRWPRNADDLQQLTEFIEQSKRYAQAEIGAGKLDQPLDLRLDAMRNVLEGKLPLVVAVDELDDIQAAVAFAARHQLKLILEGATDAIYCSDLLERQEVPVIVTGVYRNPTRRHSHYDEAYAMPKRLQDAGVSYCISAGNRFGASGIRNLPYHAATAAAYGLTPQQALRAITLSPAEILGADDRIGALRVGLDATIVVADGDILETPTQVELAFIQGRKVDLSNRHTQLYQKYSEKYRRQGE